MIHALVPASVATVSTRADVVQTKLYPDEERALGRAVARRRDEFMTGRWCARGALAALGVGACAVPSGSAGEPLWPAGVVGSITHCSGFRACAVAWSGEVRAIGIDAELEAPLPAGVLATVSAPDDDLRGLPERLLFSAKEAVFKAWYPLTRQRLAFEDVSVSFSARGAFSAAVDGSRVPGRWRISDGIVATAVVL